MIPTRHLPACPGVYRIGVQKSGRDCYIGSSVNVRDRVGDHLTALRQGRHRSRRMQAAYDSGQLQATVLELVPSNKRLTLVTREQHYFDALRPKWNNVLFASAPAQDPDVAARVAEGNRRRWTARLRERHSELTAVALNPDTKERQAQAQRERYGDARERELTSAATRRGMQRRAVKRRLAAGVERRSGNEAWRDSLSRGASERFSDPEERARTSRDTTEAMRDPETRRRISRAAKRRFSDPEERARTSAAVQRAMASPDVRERFLNGIERRSGNAEWRERGAAAAERRWRDPEYRRKQAETRARRREDPSNRRSNIVAQGGVLLTPKQEAWIARRFEPRHPERGLYAMAKKFGVHPRRIKAIVDGASR